MRRMRYHATRSLAALAMAAIPALALASERPLSRNPRGRTPARRRARALNKVLNAPVPAGDTFKKVSDLKTEYLLLERAASTASPEWLAHYTAIDRLIGDLLGASPSSTEAGAVGTSGRAGSPAGRLDAGAAANLQDFRTHLMAFSVGHVGRDAERRRHRRRQLRHRHQRRADRDLRQQRVHLPLLLRPSTGACAGATGDASFRERRDRVSRRRGRDRPVGSGHRAD